jgi:hypothetical protein
MSSPGPNVAVANPVRPSTDLVVAPPPPPPPPPEQLTDDSRFVDYVVVCTLKDNTVEDGGAAMEKDRWEMKLNVNARFPEDDWDDSPFPGALPLFCLPTTDTVESHLQSQEALTFPFVLTQADGDHLYGTCLLHVINDEDEDGEDAPRKRPEALCIVSKWPMFTMFEACLRWSHDIAFKVDKWSSVQALRIVEEFFSKLVMLVLPPKAVRVQLMLQSPGLNTVKESVIRDKPGHSLPFIDDSCFYVLADHLEAENILHILEAMVMEQKIMIHGSELSHITKISEALLSLIFPLEWPFVYIPLVPPSLVDYLHAPLPFVMGIHSSNFLVESVIPVMPQCVVINLNQKIVIDPMQLRPLPGATMWSRDHETDTIPSFPHELTAAVEFHMAHAIATIRARADAPSQSVVDEAVRVLRSSALGLMTSLLHFAFGSLKPAPKERETKGEAPCCREIFDFNLFLHKKLLDGTSLWVTNSVFSKPGSIGLSIVKSPTGYGIVGGGDRGVRGQAKEFDIKLGDVLLAVNGRSILSCTYREAIATIVQAGRPVMLSFGRIKDKYTAQQFYGQDIPQLMSFATAINPSSFSTNFSSPGTSRRSIGSNTKRNRQLRWNMVADGLYFMSQFCASQVFATVIEDSLFPMKQGNVNQSMGIFSHCLDILQKSRDNDLDCIMALASSKLIFYNEQPQNVVELCIIDEQKTIKDDGTPSDVRPVDSPATPGSGSRRRQSFTAMNLQGFNSPSAASSSPSLRNRPSFRARFKSFNTHLEPMWSKRPTSLSAVSDGSANDADGEESSFANTSVATSLDESASPSSHQVTTPAKEAGLELGVVEEGEEEEGQ